jgi:hypothetical protein
MKGNIFKKATYEDRFYRNWCTGKVNHPQNWAKDKKRNRKNFRRWLNEQLRRDSRIDEE